MLNHSVEIDGKGLGVEYGFEDLGCGEGLVLLLLLLVVVGCCGLFWMGWTYCSLDFGRPAHVG